MKEQERCMLGKPGTGKASWNPEAAAGTEHDLKLT